MGSNQQLDPEMQEALDAYQAYKAHKSSAQPRSPLIGDIADKAKALAEGAGQGLTLGNVGNIGGAAQSLASYLGKPGQTDRDLESQGFKIQQPSAFDVGKRATNDELDKSYADNPWTYRAGFVGGSTPLAAPGRAIFDAAGGGIKGGMALGGAQGAVSSIDTDNPMNQAYKAAGGAALGGAIQGVGQLANKGLGLVKKYSGNFARMSPAQADAYTGDIAGTEEMAKQLGNASENPQGMVDLQNKARDAINGSRAALKGQGLANASQLRTALDGKTVTLNPNDYMGLDPRVDELLTGEISRAKTTSDPVQAFKSLTGSDVPDSLELDANQANKLKRYLQDGADFAKGTVVDPVQKAKYGQLASKSAGLRSAIEQVAPEASGLNKSMQDSMMLQQALRQGSKTNPLAFVSTESPDRMATLARAETKGAGGLFDLGNQLGAAKAIAGKNVGSGIDSSLLKATGRAGLRMVSLFEPAAKELSDFPFIQQLIQSAGQGSAK